VQAVCSSTLNGIDYKFKQYTSIEKHKKCCSSYIQIDVNCSSSYLIKQ